MSGLKQYMMYAHTFMLTSALYGSVGVFEHAALHSSLENDVTAEHDGLR